MLLPIFVFINTQYCSNELDINPFTNIIAKLNGVTGHLGITDTDVGINIIGDKLKKIYIY